MLVYWNSAASESSTTLSIYILHSLHIPIHFFSHLCSHFLAGIKKKHINLCDGLLFQFFWVVQSFCMMCLLKQQLRVFTPPPIKYAFSPLKMPFIDFLHSLTDWHPQGSILILPPPQYCSSLPPSFPPLNYPECPESLQVRPCLRPVLPTVSAIWLLSHFEIFFIFVLSNCC